MPRSTLELICMEIATMKKTKSIGIENISAIFESCLALY